jgi:hypothetical protein
MMTSKLFAAAILLSAAMLTAVSSTSLAQDASAASTFPDEGIAPSTWSFDANGRLSSVPGVMEATYDKDGQLTVLIVHEAAKGGVRTTTYTRVAGATAGTFDVRKSYTQNGDRPSADETYYKDVSRFFLEPYFVQVEANGQKVPVATPAALKADLHTILAGIRIVLNHEESLPIFLGGTYRAHLSF